MVGTSRGSILIVEDESIVALDLARCLKGMDYSVLQVVDSGEKSIEVAKEKKPDLILMDIRLKGKMDGITAAQRITSQFDIPVVYLTAYADDQTLQQATSTAPYGYLVKPFEARELKSTIEVAIFKHKMERRLKESQERFREIFEQNFDAIIVIKLDNFEIIDLNPEAISMFQLSKDELRKGFSSVFDNEETFRLFRQEMSNFQALHNQFFLDRCQLKKKDGTKIICSIKANIIKLHQEDVLYCSFRDITEKIKFEEEAKLLQSKLIQANKMASLGTLASGLAHEINNPNNFIMSNTQIVQEVWNEAVEILHEHYTDKGDFSLGGLYFSEAEEVVPQLLRDNLEGARRIKSITENLKDYSRPQNGQTEKRVSINKVLEFSISILKNQIKKYTDNFSFEPGENIPLFSGNFQQIEQVIINLIQNALHSLPDRTCGIRVWSFYDKKEDVVVVKVIDDGIGMNPKILDRITDPFFTTKQDQGGTGLGLYISYSIVKSHQGIMEFNSLPGEGTVVTIKIPISAPGKKGGNKKI